MLVYDEVIECQGIKVPFVSSIITPAIERPLRKNRYEGGECAALRRVLRPEDRVLELGAGLGLLSTLAGSFEGIGGVVAVEANPGLIPLIRETHRLNGVTDVDLRHGVVTADRGEDADFYIRADFWASSLEPDSRPYTGVATVRRFALADLIAEFRPTVIVCDIEGGELGLFETSDLGGVRSLVIEFHPKVYGAAGQQQIIAALATKGLDLVPGGNTLSTVQQFRRIAAPKPAKANLPQMPARTYRDWPIRAPKILVTTCMKDEGPFILEWLAWHKAIGVTDFIVFTNDCSDGTDALLDRLQELGELTHLANPAIAAGATNFQPFALNVAHGLPQMQSADFFISMDVDEFVNIRTGDGTFGDLFRVTGQFDVLSISEVNHGSNRIEHFAPGWVTDQFPLHQSVTPGWRKSRRGIKSIVRLSERVLRLRNHRPDMTEETGPVVWLDGSGRPLNQMQADPEENGIDCRGTYELVRLEHFALRSLDSYIAKMFRGDVVVAGKAPSRAYWGLRNQNALASGDYGRVQDLARAYYRQNFEADATLIALHEACCHAHAGRIASLLQDPIFRERWDWARNFRW